MKKLTILFAIILALAMQPALTMADVTVTNKIPTTIGHRHALWCDGAFDSSYEANGEPMPYTELGFNKVDQIMIYPQKGYTFEYDYDNYKVKVFMQAPAIVYDEKHTASSYGITLDYPAAWIINCADAAGNLKLIAPSNSTESYTPGSGEIQLSTIADGVRTTMTTYDTSQVVYITYATQAWKDLYDLLVQDEAEALTNATAPVRHLTYSMCAFGYCTTYTLSDHGNYSQLTAVDFADTAAATEIQLNFTSSTATDYSVNSAQFTGRTAYFTYLKQPTSGTWLHDRFVADEDATAASVGSYSTNTFDHPLLMWNITGAVCGNGETTNTIIAEYSSVAALSSAAQINWGYRGAVASGVAPAAGFLFTTPYIADGTDITAGVYFKGHPWEIPNLVPLEAKDGTDLRDLTGVKIQIIGR